MSEIQYMEKPDWVSWDDVVECMRAANTVNLKKGFQMNSLEVKPAEIEEDLKDGKCFVALCGGKVVGTMSYKIRNLRKWYRRGNVIYYSYDGIRPEYRGTDVYLGLSEIRDRIVRESGLRIHQFNTAVQNKSVIRMNKLYGYKLVQFNPTGKGCNYYSVTMIRWDDGCPFPKWFLNFMFNLSKCVSEFLFTPDSKFRPSLKRYINTK